MSNAGRRDNSFDRQLRQVPTPEGMLARLKQIAAGSDEQLDALLREVPLPGELLNRLKAIPEDMQLDAQLADVTVPADLVGRLQQIAEPEATDTLAGDGPQHQVLLSSLQVEARHRRLTGRGRARWPWRLAAAAVLFFALGIYYYAANPALRSTAERAAPEASGGNPSVAGERAPAEPLPAGSREAKDDSPALAREAAVAATRSDESAVQRARRGFGRPESRGPTADAQANRAVPEPRRDIMSTPLSGELPDIDKIEPLVPKGIAPPKVPQFDLLRLMRDSVHPFVSPAAAKPLRASQVPLVTRRTSYDKFLRALEDGRLLPPEEVRVEEFLAAMEYDFPPPRSGMPLALRTAAGPSLFGSAGMHMLQVGVQAAGRLGRGLPLADDARLVVHFNPAVVREYRLLGHESNSVAGLVSGPIAANLLSGQTATALYELKLNPQGGDTVAVAELTWQDVRTGRNHRLRQRISRLQFAGALNESAVSLQRAAFAAEAAEVLRRSPYRPAAPVGLRRILEFAPAVPSVVSDEPSFQSLLEMVERAHRVGTNRSLDRKSSSD